MSVMEGNGRIAKGTTHGTVEFLMRRMRFKGDLPTFSEHITEINSKLSSLTAIQYASVGDLSRIILKDFSLTNKILRVVNSAMYSSLSGKVTTISKAVFLLGFEKVRMISAALLIYDHLENKVQASELKEVAVNSFMSGVIAMKAAHNVGGVEREEAFVCAMLHSLGKMLVICYLPEEYRVIRNQQEQNGSDETVASKSVLGVSYSDLGMAVSRSWNFPDKIVRSMEFPPAGIVDRPRSEKEILRNIAHYSNDLLEAVLSGQGADRQESLARLSKRYQNCIALSAEKMETLIDSALEDIDDYSFVIRADRAVDELKKKLGRTSPEALVDSTGEEGAVRPERSARVSVARSPEPAVGSPERRRAIAVNGIREIADVIKSGRNLSDVVYMIVETMYRGFGFDRVIFCVRDITNSKMVARFGLGENAEEIVKRFQFPISKSTDVFNIAVSQSKGILIDDAKAPSIARTFPEWYRETLEASSFVIYPLACKGSCIGMFYADRRKREILMTDEQKSHMESLRSMAIQAITQKGG